MWSTGALQRPRGRSEEAKFSERLWGKTANEYMGSIINLTEEQWDKILAKAELCARGLDEHVGSPVVVEVCWKLSWVAGPSCYGQALGGVGHW